MKVLALDTSNQPMSVALLDDQQVLAQKTTTTQLNHSVQLMPTIAELMDEVNWQPAMLERIVVAQGPGSYTGLRIAVTTAKTLAATLNIELVGVSSLRVLAAGVPEQTGIISPLFDARNTQLYAGAYRFKNGELVTVLPDQHTNLEAWTTALAQLKEPVTLIGETTRFHDDLVAALKDQVSFVEGDQNLPNAGILGQIGLEMSPITDIDGFVPNYLRLSPAEAQWAAAHPGETHTNYVEEV